MYLVNTDLEKKWDELQIECDNPACQRICKDNIQPCSLDCCLSNVFWVPSGKGIIDLRDREFGELKLRRYWKQIVLKPGESLVLKPGRVVLGRLAPKLTIPRDCAGKIEGRSSFARLGIGVHTTGDFINPGYRGHMPLQLFNYGARPVRISPYEQICQLMLIQLSSYPSKLYGSNDLLSRYSDDDDGSPYRLWNKKMKKLMRRLLKDRCKNSKDQEAILGRIEHFSVEIMDRLAKFISKWENISDLKVFWEQFGLSEDRLRRRHNILHGIYLVLFILVGGSAFPITITVKPFGILHYILWFFTTVAILLNLFILKYKDYRYCGMNELRKLEDD